MRWKLLVGNILAVLIVGLASWVVVKDRAAQSLVRDAEPSVLRAQWLLEAVRAQDGNLLLDAAQTAARSPGVDGVYAADNESAQRAAAFPVAEDISRQMASIPRRSRPAELVALVNAEGVVLARNIDRNVDQHRNLAREFPAVAHALAGATGNVVHDYLRNNEQGWLEVAVVPVVREGHVRGALVVGFTVADSAARSDASRIGVDVGYLFREGEHMTVQSLSAGQQREKGELQTWANTPGNVLGSHQRARLNLGGSEFLVMSVTMPGVFSQRSVGAVVLRNVTDARAPSGDVAFPILLLMALGLAVVIGVNLYIAAYMQKPIEQIEESLLQIINGNQQVRIEITHDELGGVVYRINQLVAQLTGEGDEGSEGD